VRVTVCELRTVPDLLVQDWENLAAHVRANDSDLVLLPEFPFYRWLPATADVNPAEWENSVREHAAWMARFPDLGVRTVVATQPVIDAGRRFNEGFVWSRDRGILKPVHRKCYLPEEDGFWEASWYVRGDADFLAVDDHRVRIGFLICTELWFLERAREYGKQGVQLIVCPRATPASTTDKWLAGGRVAAVVSGAFCLSSNFSGNAGKLGEWGGTGWIIEPESGEILGTSSHEEPFLTVDVDPAAADAAKSTYPRYVLD